MGVQGATGSGAINWRLGRTPAPLFSNKIRAGAPGGEVLLDSGVTNGVPTATFQWWHNGERVAGAAGSTLILQTLAPGDSGVYTVIAQNTYGAITNRCALLQVGPPIEILASSGTDRLSLHFLADPIAWSIRHGGRSALQSRTR